MIPPSIIAELAGLELSAEQREAVARMLCMVEAATEEKITAAIRLERNQAVDLIEERRARDRDRKARKRAEMSAECPRKSAEVRGKCGTSAEPPEPYKDNRAVQTARADALIPVGKPNGLPPVLVSTPHPTDGPPKNRKPRNTTPSPDVREILSECLCERSVDDLIAHRKAKRCPMTPGAARALVKQFQAFGDPEKAVEAMQARGWTGFKPDWMDDTAGSSRTRSSSHNSGRYRNGFSVIGERLAEREYERQQKRQAGHEAADIAEPLRLLPLNNERERNASGYDDFSVSGCFKRVSR